MKLRSIHLTNFRKFVGTVGVDGITDGVNLLVGQNEVGKSTLLEAINGVIFEKAKSQTEHVKNFRHFVNGTVPEVELAFDLDGTRWTIQKRFAGQSGKAVLTSSDHRRFEDEAAELELQRLLEFGGFCISPRKGAFQNFMPIDALSVAARVRRPRPIAHA
jgi:DNA repair exonuclease SbcCD ATPase subunit